MARRRRMTIIIVACISSLIVLWIGREQFFLLGDGTLLPRTLPYIQTTQQFVTYFHYEPLAGFFNWKFYQLTQTFVSGVSAASAVQIINTSFGCACLVALIPLARVIAVSSTDRILTYLTIISSGGTIILFGYVENYTSVLLGVIVYYYVSIQYISEKIHPVFPAVIFGVLVAFHFGMLVLTPSFLFLLFITMRRARPLETLAMLIISLLTFSTLMLVLGYPFDALWARILGSNQHVLGLTGTRSEFQAYPLISFRHFVDIINIHWLLCPFALIIIITLFVVSKGIRSNLTTISLYLLISACCGIIFTIVFNFDFGMARDWDLLVPFHIGLILASISFILQIENINIRHRIFVITIVITFLHTLTWLLITSDEERGIARYSVLADPKIWGKKTLTAAYEEQAIYYRDKKDYIRSVEYFQRFLLLDSTNSRVLHNYVTTAKLTGDRNIEIATLEQAIQWGLRDPVEYKRIAALYLQNGEGEKAGKACEAALELDPNSIELLNTVGMFYRDFKKDGNKGLSYFRRAIEIDSTKPLAYLNAGLVYNSLENGRMTKYYLNRYLQLDSTGKYAPLARNILQKRN